MYNNTKTIMNFLKPLVVTCFVFEIIFKLEAIQIASTKWFLTMALELTDSNFKAEILDYQGVAVVDFWAVWCGPCKMISPIIDEMSEKYDNIKVGKVDVDNNPDTAVEFGIRSIPTVLFLKNAEVVDKIVGSAPKSAFFDKVDELIK